MITVAQIQAEAVTFADTTITVSNARSISAMKWAMGTIGERSGYEYQIDSASYQANVWNADVLPQDSLGITEVNVNDSLNSIYNGYRVRGRDVLFLDAGTYIIHYTKLPDMPTELASELKVHPAYKFPLVQFLIAYCRSAKWEGEDGLGQALYAEFDARVSQVWDRINRPGPVQLIVQRHR